LHQEQRRAGSTRISPAEWARIGYKSGQEYQGTDALNHREQGATGSQGKLGIPSAAPVLAAAGDAATQDLPRCLPTLAVDECWALRVLSHTAMNRAGDKTLRKTQTVTGEAGSRTAATVFVLQRDPGQEGIDR
jgi:hypothetical protein